MKSLSPVSNQASQYASELRVVLQSLDNGSTSLRPMRVVLKVIGGRMRLGATITIRTDITDLDLVDLLSGGRVDLTYGR
jgi:hypothetical protein